MPASSQAPRRLTHEERHKRREQMARQVKRGVKVQTVASRFGVTIRTVYDACREFGVPATGGGRPPKRR